MREKARSCSLLQTQGFHQINIAELWQTRPSTQLDSPSEREAAAVERNRLKEGFLVKHAQMGDKPLLSHLCGELRVAKRFVNRFVVIGTRTGRFVVRSGTK